MSSMSDRLASLEAALQRMDRERREQAKLVLETIKRNISKRNVDEDELLRDVEAVIASYEDDAESDEHTTPSVADTDQSPSPGPSTRDKEAIRFFQELRPLLLNCRSSQVD